MIEKNYYENNEIWDVEKYLNNTMEMDRYINTMNLIPEDVSSLLDVGSGNGVFLKVISNKVKEIKGIERSEVAVNVSRQEFNLDIDLGSIDNLPYDSGSFDIVTCNEVIEHLPYKVYEQSLIELERVSKKYILISVPYKEKRQKVNCPYCGCDFFSAYHLREFDEQGLKFLFRDYLLKSTILIGQRKKILFESELGNLYRKMLGKKIPISDKTICPQCNYSKPKKNGNSINNQSDSLLKNFIKSILPTKNEYRWILALYEKK